MPRRGSINQALLASSDVWPQSRAAIVEVETEVGHSGVAVRWHCRRHCLIFDILSGHCLPWHGVYRFAAERRAAAAEPLAPKGYITYIYLYIEGFAVQSIECTSEC